MTTYKDINNSGNRVLISGKDPVDNGDICVAEATCAGGVGFQILQQGLEVYKHLWNVNNLALT